MRAPAAALNLAALRETVIPAAIHQLRSLALREQQEAAKEEEEGIPVAAKEARAAQPQAGPLTLQEIPA